MEKRVQPLPFWPTKEEVDANAAVPCAHCNEPMGQVAGRFALTCQACGQGIHFRCGTTYEGGRKTLWCPVTPHRRHQWDFDTWVKGAENFSPLLCSNCGQPAQHDGIDVSADCSCGVAEEGTYFDPSDHSPGCAFHGGKPCPQVKPDTEES